MAISKTKSVQKGGWRTLESGWNVEFWVSFVGPRDAEIKVRYGTGWPLGWDSQKQRLDGQTTKWVQINKNSSKAYARVQIKVRQDVNVSYIYYPAPFDGLPPLQ